MRVLVLLDMVFQLTVARRRLFQTFREAGDSPDVANLRLLSIIRWWSVRSTIGWFVFAHASAAWSCTRRSRLNQTTCGSRSTAVVGATGMSAQAVVLATVCEHKLATQQPLQRGLRAVHVCMPCWISSSARRTRYVTGHIALNSYRLLKLSLPKKIATKQPISAVVG